MTSVLDYEWRLRVLRELERGLDVFDALDVDHSIWDTALKACRFYRHQNGRIKRHSACLPLGLT
jgi:hypothetical protein